MKTKTLLISIVSFIISILGIANELNHILLNNGLFAISNVIFEISPVLDLRFFHNIFAIDFKGASINFGDLLVYVLLLIGSLTYIFSRRRESRLLGFSLSILFLSCLIIILPKPWKTIHVGYAMSNYLSVLPKSIIWSAVIIYILRSIISSQNKLEMSNQILASKYYRLIHFILDPLICILIFYQYSLVELENFSLVLSGIIYYLFYEGLFGQTPIKFLTGTLVRSDDGKKLNFTRVLLRTIIRLIPIEFITFIFNKNGWHDKWSKSIVISQKKQKFTRS